MTAPDITDLVRGFEAGPAELRAAWNRVPADKRQWRPAPGKWSAHEVVLHCADTQMVSGARLRYLLAETDPVLVGWDQDKWAAELDYHAHPIEPAFALIEAATAHIVVLVRRMTAETFARPGWHTEKGAITVGSWFPYNADHLQVHARQIDRIVAALQAH